jgi:plasmid stabilization system protein ParE
MYNVDVHPDVYAELEHSRAWYGERAQNLGTEFLVEVDRAIEAIRESPALWPFRDKPRGIQRYLVHRFPYGVIYRLREQTVQIVAVMHLRRHPNYWRGRVQHWNGNPPEHPPVETNATSG